MKRLGSALVALLLCSAATLTLAQEDKGKKPNEDKAVRKLPGLAVFVAEKRIEVEAAVCLQQSSQLEVLACTPRGKTHESLVLLDCDPQHFQLALIMLGLKPTPQVKQFGEVKALDKGSRVTIEVEWSEGTRLLLCPTCYKGQCGLHKDPMRCSICPALDRKGEGGWCENCMQGWRWGRQVSCRKCWLRTCEGHFMRECKPCKDFTEGRRKTHCPAAVDHGDVSCRRCNRLSVKGMGWCDLCQRGYKGGRPVRHRIEDLVYNRYTERAMERAGWVFTGSREIKIPVEQNKTRKVFGASHSGNLIACYHDPDAILDTPLLAGGDDTAFVPHAERLPPRRTPLTLHIRPWKEGDEKGSPDAGKGVVPGKPGGSDKEQPKGKDER